MSDTAGGPLLQGQGLAKSYQTAAGAVDVLRDVDLEVEAQRDDAYAAVNPQHKILALFTPAGETLTESVAILCSAHTLCTVTWPSVRDRTQSVCGAQGSFAPHRPSCCGLRARSATE